MYSMWTVYSTWATYSTRPLCSTFRWQRSCREAMRRQEDCKSSKQGWKKYPWHNKADQIHGSYVKLKVLQNANVVCNFLRSQPEAGVTARGRKRRAPGIPAHLQVQCQWVSFHGVHLKQKGCWFCSPRS